MSFFKHLALLLLLLVFGCFSTLIKGQSSVSIQGIVTNFSDNQPIEGANVLLINKTDEYIKGGVTDRNGLYQLNNVKTGTYLFKVSFIGYKTFVDSLTITEDDSTHFQRVKLSVDSEVLDELVVSVKSEAARLKGGYQQVSPIDLTRAVTPAGGGDIATYLQALPGVVAAGDRGGQLFVRGGSPSENLVLVDGLVIYQPFHIVGFFSAFPENLLANADFYAGGFGPKYSERISSVLDIHMREGDFQEISGSVSLSPFLGEIQLESPLRKGKTSVIGSVRSSQIERTSGTLLKKKQPLKFDSQFLKFTQLSENGTRCSAMVMRTYDRGKLDFEKGNSFSWSNLVIGGKCTYLSQDPNIFVDFNAGLSHLSNSLGGNLESDLTSGITRFGTNLNMTQYLNNVKLNYGVFSSMKWLNYDIEQLFQLSSQKTDILLDVRGYIETIFPVTTDIRVMPGASVSLYPNTYKPSFEPRLRISWQPFGTEDQELNTSIGVYRQTVAGISDLRDVGSAFIAWVPTPNGDRSEAVHALLGWRQRFKNSLQFSVEGYYKRLKNIPVSVWSSIAEFTTELDFANGKIFGADVRLEYTNRKFYGFIGYGLSWTEYTSSQDNFNIWFGVPVQRYNPAHDRRHEINSMASLDIGQFTIGLRWQIGSGLPFTRQMGFDGIVPFDKGLPNIRTNYGRPRAILDKPFEGRTPYYHRLDFSLERDFNLRFAKLEVQIGAINIYDRTNLFYYDVFTQRRINQLPFAPYASMKVEF